MRHFRPILNHFGLTEQQWRILRVLAGQARLEPREICAHCQILGPSLTGVLARMDDMGLVTRDRMPEDQRRVSVELSSQGKKLVAQIQPLVQAQYRLLEKSLGRELLEALYVALDQLLDDSGRPAIGRIALPNAKKTATTKTAAKIATAKTAAMKTTAAKTTVMKTATTKIAVTKPATTKTTVTKIATTKTTVTKPTTTKTAVTKPVATKTTTTKTTTTKIAASKTTAMKTANKARKRSA